QFEKMLPNGGMPPVPPNGGMPPFVNPMPNGMPPVPPEMGKMDPPVVPKGGNPMPNGGPMGMPQSKFEPPKGPGPFDPNESARDNIRFRPQRLQPRPSRPGRKLGDRRLIGGPLVWFAGSLAAMGLGGARRGPLKPRRAGLGHRSAPHHHPRTCDYRLRVSECH